MAQYLFLSCSGSLDVMRVDSGDGKSQSSVMYAAYGYMGDIMRRSEQMRWLGRIRHIVSGAVAFLLGRSYSAQICYVPAERWSPIIWSVAIVTISKIVNCWWEAHSTDRSSTTTRTKEWNYMTYLISSHTPSQVNQNNSLAWHSRSINIIRVGWRTSSFIFQTSC